MVWVNVRLCSCVIFYWCVYYISIRASLRIAWLNAPGWPSLSACFFHSLYLSVYHIFHLCQSAQQLLLLLCVRGVLVYVSWCLLFRAVIIFDSVLIPLVTYYIYNYFVLFRTILMFSPIDSGAVGIAVAVWLLVNRVYLSFFALRNAVNTYYVCLCVCVSIYLPSTFWNASYSSSNSCCARK